MGVENVLTCIKHYSTEDKMLILRAYEFAAALHKEQKRKSGEPYIIHPLNVALILAEMHADADTICAGLLHDIIEDCKITKEDLAAIFNETIAELVDGVSKLDKMEFGNNKELAEEESFLKMVKSVIKDIRVILIKLADKLHNMRTEQFQSQKKQVEHSKETRDFYVPFARYIGARKIMIELEDISFQYLNPKEYENMQNILQNVEKEYYDTKDEILASVLQVLNSNAIPFDVKVRIKTPFELFKKLCRYANIDHIHDLYAIKIFVRDLESCYRVIDLIESSYRVIEEKRKDYIYNPKENHYRALHTTIVHPNGKVFQFQVETEEMYNINTYGLMAYWKLMRSKQIDPVKKMQEDVSTFPFFAFLKELEKSKLSNHYFYGEVKDNLFSDKIYVFTPTGERIDLPEGSTPIDFAYKIHSEIGDAMTHAFVNGEPVPFDYKLKKRDTVTIEYDFNFIGPRVDTSKMCKTTRAKRCIKELQKTHYTKMS